MRKPRASTGGTHHPAYYRTPTADEKPLAPKPPLALVDEASAPQGAGAAARAGVDRSKMPEVGEIADLDFPDIQRTRLANGIEVVYAQRTAVPVTRVSVELRRRQRRRSQGAARHPGADARPCSTRARPAAIRSRSPRSRSGSARASAPSASIDRTNVGLSALTPNLAPSLDLLADIVRNPAFDPSEVERLRGEQLARIASEMTQPQGLALRALPPLIYGAAHPYGVPFTGTGDPKAVEQVGRDDLVAFHNAWLRPDNAKIFVVSDRAARRGSAAARRARSAIGRRPPTARGSQEFRRRDARAQAADRADRSAAIAAVGDPRRHAAARTRAPRISTDARSPPTRCSAAPSWRASTWICAKPRAGPTGSTAGSTGWSSTVPYIVSAPVQADQTGPSIAALRTDMIELPRPRRASPPPSASGRSTTARAAWPASSRRRRTCSARCSRTNSTGGPTIITRRSPTAIAAMTAPQLDKAARDVLDPAKLVWVVVGDAKQVRPQLDKLGLPVEVVPAK